MAADKEKELSDIVREDAQAMGVIDDINSEFVHLHGYFEIHAIMQHLALLKMKRSIIK